MTKARWLRRAIDVVTMPDGAAIRVNVHSISGSAGPTLVVIAGQHGNEMTPIQTARRFIESLDTGRIQGAVHVVPVANPLAVGSHTRCTPLDGLDGNGGNLNRAWPGRADGFVTDRLASVIWSDLIVSADAVIDLHDGTDTMSLYYGYRSRDDTTAAERLSNELSHAFGMEVLVDLPAMSGSLSTVGIAHGVPVVACELGDFFGIRATAEDSEVVTPMDPVDVGLRGITNVLRRLGMLPGDVTVPERQVAVRDERPLGFTRGGLLESHVSRRDIGRVVAGGTMLGVVISPVDFRTLEELRAPYDQTLILAVTETPSIGLARPGGGDFGYYVADWATAQWIKGGSNG